MHMIGHHDCDVEFVFATVIVTARSQRDVSCGFWKDPSVLSAKRDEMRPEIALEMRKIPSVELHNQILAARERERNG